MSANILDQQEVYQQFDTDNLRQHLENFPRELGLAGVAVEKWELNLDFDKIASVAVCGMGGSGIAGRIAASVTGKSARVPVTVVADYNLPAWIGKDSLVVLVSYSGDTEEVLSCARQAKERGAEAAVVTAGGKLAEMARENGWPVWEIDYVAPPRAALAHLLPPVIKILTLVMGADSGDRNWEELAEDLKKINSECGAEVEAEKNPAKKLAEFCQQKRVTVISGEHLLAAGKRLKTQLNENAKQWAESEELPELYHNFIEGFSFPVDNRVGTGLVILESENYGSRTRCRLTWLRQYLKTGNWASYDLKVPNGHGGAPGELLGAILIGDWASYYLAMLNRVNPSPVEVIKESKEYLSTCH